jgi:large subunit ribosomal protein L35
MPKMKTKSSCKKRFKISASGRIIAGQAGKQHGMIKRSKKIHPQCARDHHVVKG